MYTSYTIIIIIIINIVIIMTIRPSASATDCARDVLPMPGGPLRQRIGPDNNDNNNNDDNNDIIKIIIITMIIIIIIIRIRIRIIRIIRIIIRPNEAEDRSFRRRAGCYILI